VNNPVAVFRWVTVCLIVWVLVLCSGCAGVSDKTQFQVKQIQYQKTVYLYADLDGLRAARVALNPSADASTIEGFAYWKDGSCEVHVLAVNDADDMWLRAGTWGHEEMHCVYGAFHNGKYRGHP